MRIAECFMYKRDVGFGLGEDSIGCASVHRGSMTGCSQRARVAEWDGFVNCCSFFRLCPCFPVVLRRGKDQHPQYLSPRLVCRWHTAGRGLQQWPCHFCPCGGSALAVEELRDHPHQEKIHAGVGGFRVLPEQVSSAFFVARGQLAGLAFQG